MDPAVLSAIITAAGAAASGAGSALGSMKWRYRKNYRWTAQQERLRAAQQLAINHAQTLEQRKYDDPSAQMARMTAAGISPHTAVASIAPGSSAETQPVSLQPNVSVPPEENIAGAILSGIGGIGSSIGMYAKRKQELKKGELELQKMALDNMYQSNKIDKFVYDFVLQKLDDQTIVDDGLGNDVTRHELRQRGLDAKEKAMIFHAANLPEDHAREVEKFVNENQLLITKNEDLIQAMRIKAQDAADRHKLSQAHLQDIYNHLNEWSKLVERDNERWKRETEEYNAITEFRNNKLSAGKIEARVTNMVNQISEKNELAGFLVSVLYMFLQGNFQMPAISGTRSTSYSGDRGTDRSSWSIGR